MAGTGLKLKIAGDLKDLKRQISAISGPAKQAQKELKEIERALKFNPGNAELVAQKQQVLAERVEELKSKLEALKEAKKEADQQFESGKISEEQYRAINREIVTTEDQLRRAVKAQKDFNLESQRAASAVGKIGDAAEKAGNKLQSAGGKLNGIGNKLMPITAGVGALAAGTAKVALDFLKLKESAKVAFTTLLGGEDKAVKMMDDLYAFAKTTPFPYDEYLKAGQNLVAMGVSAKDAVPYLKAVTDATVGIGGNKEDITGIADIFGKMTANGKVYKSELTQLSKRGVPAIKIMANAYGVTTEEMNKMIRSGKVLSDDALPKLIKGMNEGTDGAAGMTAAYGGMAEKMKGTLGGAVDSVKSKFRNMAIEMWNADEAYPELVKAVNAFEDALGALPGVFNAIGKIAAPALTTIASGLQKFAKWANETDPKNLERIGKAILYLAAAGPSLKIVGKLSMGLGAVSKGFSIMTKTKAAAYLVNFAKTAKFTTGATTALTAATTGQAAAQKTINTLYGSSATAMRVYGGSVTKAGAATANMGNVAGKAATGTTAMRASVLGLHPGVLAVTAGIAAAAFAFYQIKKAIDEANFSYLTAKDRAEIAAKGIEESNKALDAVAERQVEAFKKSRQAIETELSNIESSGKVITKKTAESLNTEVKTMMDGIIETIKGSQEGAKDAFSSAFAGTTNAGNTEFFAAIDEAATERIGKAKEIEDKITAIISQAGAERRNLTKEEKKKLLKLEEEAFALQVEAVTTGESSLYALEENLKSGRMKISAKTAKETTKQITDTNKKALKDLEKMRADGEAAAANTFGVGTKGYKKALKLLDESISQKKAKIEKSTEEQLKIVKEGLEKEAAAQKKAIETKGKGKGVGGYEGYKKLKKEWQETEAELKKINNSIADATKAKNEAIEKSGKDGGGKFAKGFKSMDKLIKQAAKDAAKKAKDGAKEGSGGIDKEGKNAGDKYAKGIDDSKPKIKKSGHQGAKEGVGGAKEGGKGMVAAGTSMTLGMISGMMSNPVIRKAIKAALALVNKVKNTITGKSGFDSSSPSKWAIKTIDDVADGMVISSQQNAQRLSMMGMSLAGYVTDGFSIALSGGTMISAMSKLYDALLAKQKSIDAQLEKMRADAEKRRKAKEKKDYEKQLKELQKKYKKATKKEKAEIKKQIRELKKARKEALKEEKRQAKQEELEKQKQVYETAISNLESFYQKRNDLAKKWAGGGLFKDDSGILSLNNFEEDIRKLEELDNELGKLEQRTIPKELLAEIGEMSTEDALRYAQALNYMTDIEFKNYIDLWKKREDLSKKIATGFLKDEANELVKSMTDAGIKAADGLISAMNSKNPEVKAAAEKMAKQITIGVNGELQIKSPSRKTEWSANMGVDGFVRPFIKRKNEVKEAMRAMAAVDVMREQMEIANNLLLQSQKSRAMEQGTAIVNAMAATGTEGKPIHLHLHVGAREMAEEIYDPFKDIERRKG